MPDEYGQLTEHEIRERLLVQHRDIITSRTNFFSSAVPEGKIRYIVQITLNGDGVTSRTVDLEKVEEDATYTMLDEKIPVSPADVRQMPEGAYNIKHPIVALEGGANICGTVSGNTVYGSCRYWDDDI